MNIRKRGQSLIEAVVVVGVVMLLISGLLIATTSALRFGQQSKVRTQAVSYSQQGMEVVRMLRDKSWTNIPNAGMRYCLEKGATTLEMTEPAGGCLMDIDAMFSRTVEFSNDEKCSVAEDCRKVTVSVQWLEQHTTPRSVSLSSYFTNWRDQ